MKIGFFINLFFLCAMTFDRICFILSAPRSGSTLLRLHLNQVPNVIALPETHFFNFKHEFRHLNPRNPQHRSTLIKKWVNYFTVSRMALDIQQLTTALEAGELTWQKMFEITLLHYRDKYHPEITEPYWVEKTPPHIFFQDDIKAMYPQSKLIFLLRDPRAVAASLRTMSFSTSNVLTISRSWKKSTHLSREGKDALILKYEDLVEAPAAAFKKVFTFLEVSGKADPNQGISSDPVEGKNWNSSETTKPIHTDNLEKWKKTLSKIDGHIQIVEKICGEEMDAYGYEKLNYPRNNGYYSTLWSYYFQFITLKILDKVFRKKARSSG